MLLDESGGLILISCNVSRTVSSIILCVLGDNTGTVVVDSVVALDVIAPLAGSSTPWAQMSWPALAESSSLHPERDLFPSYPLRWVAGFPVDCGPLVSDGHVGPHPLEEAFGDDVEHAVVSFVDIPDKLYDPG